MTPFTLNGLDHLIDLIQAHIVMCIVIFSDLKEAVSEIQRPQRLRRVVEQTTNTKLHLAEDLLINSSCRAGNLALGIRNKNKIVLAWSCRFLEGSELLQAASRENDKY